MTKSSILIGFLILALVLVLLFSVLKKRTATITIERTLNAPNEKVWRMWNDPDVIMKWWSPKNYAAPVIKNDFRINGSFLFSMRSPDGKISWNTGKYTEIVQNKRIVSTMSFSDENGTVVPASHYGIPGEWPNEVIVTVEFKEVDGKTQVKIQETGIPLIMCLFAKMGWGQQLDKFKQLLN